MGLNKTGSDFNLGDLISETVAYSKIRYFNFLSLKILKYNYLVMLNGIAMVGKPLI